MAWDPIWEDIFQKKEWGKYPSLDLVDFISINFGHRYDRQNVTILEVGCGPGANLWYMAREGFNVFGVDASVTATTRAVRRLDEECPGWLGNVAISEISKLTFSNNYFDAVVDVEAIAHNSFADAKQIYQEMYRVTKPGGKMFSQTFAEGCYPGIHDGVIRFTRLEEIEKLTGGFQVTEVELLSRTINGGKHEVKEFIITGEKR